MEGITAWVVKNKFLIGIVVAGAVYVFFFADGTPDFSEYTDFLK